MVAGDTCGRALSWILSSTPVRVTVLGDASAGGASLAPGSKANVESLGFVSAKRARTTDLSCGNRDSYSAESA